MSRTEPAERRGRVLLVEDDADAAYYAVHVLTRMGGFEVSHTHDPAVALERARSLPWDLVITDVDLPGMTGSELLEALRQAVPGLPVVVMTARAAADASLDGLRGQADAHLHKPVPPARLVAVVSALTHRTAAGPAPAESDAGHADQNGSAALAHQPRDSGAGAERDHQCTHGRQ